MNFVLIYNSNNTSYIILSQLQIFQQARFNRYVPSD